MIGQILITGTGFVLGFWAGKAVECAQWKLGIQRYNADFLSGTRSNNSGGRPRKGETAEQARQRRQGGQG